MTKKDSTQPQKPQDADQRKMDEVLRKMLKTPPKPEKESNKNPTSK